MSDSATSASASETVRHIPSLDGIRAISFLLVFAAHAGLERWVPGGFGVTIFFFLSGFLITTLLRSEYDRNGHINIRHFWLRRVLRIWPPFYIVLFGAMAATLLLYPSGYIKPAPVLAQLLHFTNYWSVWHGFAGQPIGTGVYWSLAVEEHFYLLFPWVFIAMRKADVAPRSQAIVLWLICGAVLVWRCLLVFHFHTPVDRTYLATDTRVDSILFGCALAVWLNPAIDAPVRSPTLWRTVILPFAAALLIACTLYRNAAFRETFRYTLQGVALTFLFVGAVQFHEWPIFRWLNRPVLIKLGVLSYSLYLVHFVVLVVVEDRLPQTDGWVRAALALGVSLLIAQLMYSVVERPCARLRKRLAD